MIHMAHERRTLPILRSAQVNLAIAPAESSRGARRPATLPKLAEFLGEFLTGRGPVVAHAVPEFHDVALQIEFVLLEPGNVEFLAGGAAFELAGDVFLIVAHNSA